MSRARRTDHNQREIVAALRAIGATVIITSSLGDGFPDLLVYYRRWIPMEVKMPGGRLTPAEQRLQDECPGAVPIVYSAEQAIQVVRGGIS